MHAATKQANPPPPNSLLSVFLPLEAKQSELTKVIKSYSSPYYINYHKMKMCVGAEIKLHLILNQYTDGSIRALDTAGKFFSLKFAYKYLTV